MLKRISLVLLISIVFISASAAAADWPMWRHNPGRTAASPEKLASPGDLSLAWERIYSPRETVWDDPLNNDLMQFDRIFEPVVHQGIMVIGFNDSDKVVGLDAESGESAWTFFTDGPVRLAPAAWKGKVYFTSDDGNLYCLNIKDGTLIWKKSGGP